MPLLFVHRIYIPTAIFQSPPQDSASSYHAFISPTTSNLISAYTIPAIEAALHELLVLGMEFYWNNSNMWHDTYKPGSQAMFLASLIQKMACQPSLWQMCLQTQCVYTSRWTVPTFQAYSWIWKGSSQLRWKQSWGRSSEYHHHR